jgi:hypothetical protein
MLLKGQVAVDAGEQATEVKATLLDRLMDMKLDLEREFGIRVTISVTEHQGEDIHTLGVMPRHGWA